MTELLQTGFLGLVAVGLLPALLVLIGMFLTVPEFLGSYLIWISIPPDSIPLTGLILMGLVVGCGVLFSFLGSFRRWLGVQGTVFFKGQHLQVSRIDTPSILTRVMNLIAFWWEQSFVDKERQPMRGWCGPTRSNSPVSIGIYRTNPVPTFSLRVLFRVLRYVPFRVLLNSRSAAAKTVTVKDITPAAFGIRDGQSAVSTMTNVFVCNHPNILPQEV